MSSYIRNQKVMAQTVRLNPYLSFNGTAREAMEFYHSVLGGKLDLSTYGGTMPGPEEFNDKIMHGVIESDEFVLMAGDTPNPDEYPTKSNMSISLSGTNREWLTKAFQGLSEGGTISIPLEKQVWGDDFGMFTDKFGMDWMVNISDAE
jgi:PhnB protein